MKRFTVVFNRLAIADFDEATQWALTKADAQTVARWSKRFYQNLTKLTYMPERYSLAHEHKKAKIEIRETLFGRRNLGIFRIIFTIEGDQVIILRIRRGTRAWLSRREIDELGP